MVLVPEGEFTMGSDDLPSWYDESPAHQVYLDSYYIDKFEVTNKLYKACVDSGVCEQPTKTRSYTRPDYFGNPDYGDFPVIYVDWDMANAFCKWKDARLPTEAEWEKAARGTDGRTKPWGEEDTDCNYANASMICEGDTAKVGSYTRDVSPYEIYDMAGNVVEWVAD